jgi:RNA polymerase sigma factor (sigma-70 family)
MSKIVIQKTNFNHCHKKLQIHTIQVYRRNISIIAIYNMNDNKENLSNIQSLDIIHQQELWNEYYSKVYGYFFKRVFVKEDVEEITTTTMNAFFQSLYDNTKSPSITNHHGYLWQIAKNQLYSYIKTKSSNVNLNIEDFDNFEAKPTQLFEDRMASLKQCLKINCSDEEYEMIMMLVIDNIASKEVALQFNLSPENVRQRLSRTIKRLKSQCTQLYNQSSNQSTN